jgi:lipopolysaccharide export system protein LptC
MEVPADDPLGDLRLAPLAPSLKRGTVAAPWRWRWRELVSAYLPVLLMAALALGTWWLVKNTPVRGPEGPAVAPRHDPDYTMQRFSLQRFAPDGSLRLNIEGNVMRHYPDTDTVEIDGVRLHGYAADGRVTEASARRAVSNSDGSEVQLLGNARVISSGRDGGDPIQFDGEFLHAFMNTERLRSHLPATVTRGGSQIRAEGFDYDNITRVVHYKGRVRANFIVAKGGHP